MKKNESKLIIGFDSWTEGRLHFQRLVDPLKDLGYKIKLIHFGSFGHDVGRPKKEIIGKLEVFDISYYGSKSIRGILLKEQPSAVVFLSTQSFLHQAVNRYCMMLNIPTLHLYHGLITVQAIETAQPDKFNFLAQFRIIAQRLGKNLVLIIPLYIKSLFVTRAAISSWLFLFRDIIFKILGRFKKVASPDCSTNYCAVYAKSDLMHAHTTYRIPLRNIRVVGNPDFAKFNLHESELLSCFSTCSNKKKIIYIDHGGSTSGFTFESKNDFIRFLTKSNDILSMQGYDFLVKLHPAQAKFGTAEDLKRNGVHISTEASFANDLLDSRAAITGPSSAGVIPAALGLPLILAQFDQFSDQDYGIVFRDYPRAYPLKDLKALKNILNNESIPDFHHLRLWVQKYLEPLPAEHMPKRVVETIDQMVREHESPCAV